MYYLAIIISLCSFLQSNNEKDYTIYIAKIEWHVGIILKVDNAALDNVSAIKDFSDYKYVDIGWGDAEFYQSGEDFDLFLASKAILFPTNSVIRIQGYDYGIEQIMNWRDYVFKIELSNEQFDLLCRFIDSSLLRNNQNKLNIESEKLNGRIRYYSSNLKYHLFNTCNTWVAEALENADSGIESSNIITAEELFEELIKFAHLVKVEEI